MALYGSYRDRSPQVDRAIKSMPTNSKLTYNGDYWPEIGTDLYTVITSKGLSIPVKLSIPQYERLSAVVDTPLGKFPSPIEERISFPLAWQQFIAHLTEMPTWKHQTHSMGGLINLLTHYHWMKGWFSYRPQARVEVPTDVSVPAPDAEAWLR